METKLQFNTEEYHLERYPKTEDKSLRAWSNAELLALDYVKDKNVHNIHLFNDRFGVFNCVLNTKKITTIWTYASQKKAIQQNLKLNKFSSEVDFKTPLEDIEKVELVLMKIPKSLELFEMFLFQIYKASTEKTEVVCCFMTKYFSASYLKIASMYFEDFEQTKAWKKARLLVLKNPKKKIIKKKYINTLEWKGSELKQYYGVFSSGKIDIGTQFLLNTLKIKPEEDKILDVASGNGIIAYELLTQNKSARVTLVDDFNLAVASSKLNINNKQAEFVCNDNLEDLPKNHFNLVVSNPPFHFEYENNIEVALQLFKDVQKCLVPNGRFVLVANKHLNYKTHLAKIFNKVKLVSENMKFEVLECMNN